MAKFSGTKSLACEAVGSSSTDHCKTNGGAKSRDKAENVIRLKGKKMVEVEKKPEDVPPMENKGAAFYLIAVLESARAATALMRNVPEEVEYHFGWLVRYLWQSLPQEGFYVRPSDVGMDL